MSRQISTSKQSPTQWVEMAPGDPGEGVRANCTVETVAAAVEGFAGVSVASVSINESGTVQQMPGISADDLPPFCDVRIEQQTPGGDTAHITVWVPLDWNERFLGLGGQGNRTAVPWIFGDLVRLATLPRAVRNGFATAETDAGNVDPRFAEWGLDAETRELDWELIRNWQDRSTHDMTVIAKAVINAIHGQDPRYSYFQGTSGGGRQALMEAQRYPGDYDGIWSADPAINYPKLAAACIWPTLVMKELNNPLPPAKLEAFRTGYLAAAGVEAAELGYVSDIEPRAWDPHELVGQPTVAGKITAEDADVMAKIWEGPRAADGRQLWFGVRPDTESWGENIHRVGVMTTTEVDGAIVPEPFVMANAFIGGWLLHDPEWDWTTLTFEAFETLFDQGVREFEDVSTDDPDLSGFGDSGAKLLVTHGLADEIIFAGGTIAYTDRVFATMGAQALEPFFRAYFTPGDGHSHVTAAGPGLTLAGGMVALMDWVENGVAPETLAVERYDPATGEITATGTTSPYVPDLAGVR